VHEAAEHEEEGEEGEEAHDDGASEQLAVVAEVNRLT
jgi:hypothetical protein